MADSSIGALPLASGVADDSLLVMEQQGEAMRITGGMLKGYAKQGVELEFQEYLDDAQQAAESAVGAVSAVVDMTVDAHTLETGQNATVAKTMKNGKVNLSFGLPRGEQGVPGPSGPPGPAGPQGEPGTGLDIVGRYDTTNDVPNPQEGKSYYIGTEPPYDVCTYLDGQWVNNGPLSGGGGEGPLPEDVVTSQGGASMEYGTGLGNAPHVIRFTDEDDEPLTAAEISFDPADTGMETANVQGALEELFTSVSDGKSLIASAITDKGVATAEDAAFSQMAEHIRQIPTGGDTSDATATPGDILSPKTAYTGSGKVEGTIPSLAAQTIVPGTQDKHIANGQYLAGTQTVKGDPNLTPANIRKGVTLFEVDGAMESSFKATLTVTADIGAVVTATCGDTAVEALSVTGTVVLELPIEGTWKVTAVRGAAQYNTVTLEVSSSYSASLTAEVHIEYFGEITHLKYGRTNPATASIGNYLLFAGGGSPNNNLYKVNTIDAYDTQLVHTEPTELSAQVVTRGASNGIYAVFCGSPANAYDASLTRMILSDNEPTDCVPVSIGEYILFCRTNSEVYAYDKDLTRVQATSLISGRSNAAGTSNGNYALIGGGFSSAVSSIVDAYNSSLVRTNPVQLSTARQMLSAATAGNYAVFAGGDVEMTDSDAYDLFLTRTTPENLTVGRRNAATASLRGYAIFAGGGYTKEISGIKRPFYHDTVESYDQFLILNQHQSLGQPTAFLSGGAVGDYALFGGGAKPTYNNEVETANNVYAYHYT